VTGANWGADFFRKERRERSSESNLAFSRTGRQNGPAFFDAQGTKVQLEKRDWVMKGSVLPQGMTGRAFRGRTVRGGGLESNSLKKAFVEKRKSEKGGGGGRGEKFRFL